MPDYDPILLEIMKRMLAAVAEEMGGTLGRTAFSPNIKERRDFSCAVFDAAGQMAAQAAHIPVHLGAMPLSVAAALERFGRLGPGDIVVLNDPYFGGSHLPDITMVSPVYDARGQDLLGYVASRAHHADVGGVAPGSMPLATELYQEGLIIPPILLQAAGSLNEGVLDLIARNSRTPAERRGDLAAQIAAQRIGERRRRERAERYGAALLAEYMAHLCAYGEQLTRHLIRRMPPGRFAFTDFLDDDGFGHEDLAITATVEARAGELWVDFTGTAPQTMGGVNAVRSVTLSAVFYVVRCLLGDDAAPTNAGIFRPVHVVLPEGTLVNARFPAAVAAGNVETSQRIVDVLLGAFAGALPDLVPAASQGTMNNLVIGGLDPRSGERFAYYETIGGGMGAAPNAAGLSGVHVHMTNTLNTPVEALEYAYPLRVTRYELRRGSGGAGAQRGGDGLYREVELLADATVTILAERRRHAPYGLAGAAPGAPGENLRLIPDASAGAAEGTRFGVERLPGKTTFHARAGERIAIATPGGGGHGSEQHVTGLCGSAAAQPLL
ncbi:MAG: hydantoinase B/oxoprolinase family protein [Anaerolineae bacterium]|nr:hydantoinase B/oxoprolinase family protein [Anaerolineae bacterium]